MFLRKLLVILGPLLLCLIAVVVFPLIERISDWFPRFLLMGLLLGALLAALIPLIGARRKEPFLRILWVPTVLLILLLSYQALYHSNAIDLKAIEFLSTNSSITVFMESTFLGYMITLLFRGIK